MVWDNKIKALLNTGSASVGVYLRRHSGGSIAFVDSIEKKHPGYIHELYRYTIGTIGAELSFHATASAINIESSILEEQCAALHLPRLQLNDWFVKNIFSLRLILMVGPTYFWVNFD